MIENWLMAPGSGTVRTRHRLGGRRCAKIVMGGKYSGKLAKLFLHRECFQMKFTCTEVAMRGAELGVKH